ncbi:MAG: HAMP domain-containing protein [Candidatus Aminicenantes bacterium]|nr:MAG: HAMP domain-containing protein [Candidatus Aminicenantes bacterium]
MSLIKNLSIKHKLIVIVLWVTIPSIVLGFTFIIINDVIQLRKNLVNDTQLYADLVGEVCVSPLSFGAKDGVKDIMKKLRTIPHIENGYVYDNQGQLYAYYNKNEDQPSTPPLVPAERFHKFENNQLHVSLPISYHDKKIGTIYLTISTALLAESTRNRITSLVLVMIGLIVLSYLLALRFQGLISQPILKLAKVTGQISNRPDYSLRVQKEGEDEIGILYDGFNNMLEQIQVWEKKRDKAEAEQQRLMMQLEEKNYELEQVIYVTSHDLRSPLVNLQGFSQELGYTLKELQTLINKIDTVPANIKKKFSLILEDIFDSLKYIQSSTFKMDVLLSGLLKLSRLTRMDSTFEMIDMNRLISEITNAFEYQLKEAGVNLQVGELPSCFGIELQVNQVFSNLLNNALKYLDPQRPGEIKITGETIKIDGNARYVVYCVEDNGVGIPREYHKKVFEIFQRLNPDATVGEGLGLTIVNKIIVRHHGKVWVESESGKGSKFFISLPIPPPVVEESVSSSASSYSGPMITSTS